MEYCVLPLRAGPSPARVNPLPNTTPIGGGVDIRGWLLAALLFLSFQLTAQIPSGPDTLYGNEWIDFSRTYFKIRVATDGIYRIPYQTLSNAGFPLTTVPAAQFRLYRYGVQEPVFTSTDGLFGPQDFIEFFGQRNRDALDRHLFEKPDEENLNPWYSLFSDSTAYYLTWESTGQPLRYTAVPNDLSNPPPPEPYCWFTSGYFYTNALFKRRISDELAYSWFNGEGFGTYAEADFSAGIPAKKAAPAAPDATLLLRYACDLGAHQQAVSVNDSLLTTDYFSNWGIRQHSFTLPAQGLKQTNTVRVKSTAGSGDRNSVAGIFLRYARQFDFENAQNTDFSLDGGTEPKYLEIQAFAAFGGAPVLYDLDRRLRIETAVQNNVVKVLLPPSAQPRRLWLANAQAGIFTVGALQPVAFHDYRNDDATYILLSNPALSQGPTDPVGEYADYRRSPAGGAFDVAVVDVNQLYEQFAYGTRYHPLALRNFVQFVKKHWSDPRYLLLVGKGLEYGSFRSAATQALLADSLFFVPTYGTPGADQLLAMRDKKLSEPLLAVGRLAVSKPSEIRDYLQKVKEHELAFAAAPQNLAGKAWMKRVIHNSGGLAGEQALIRTYVESMGAEIAANRVGADVSTYFKTSNDPIQLSSYEQMLDQINDGVSIWMIFGHSSPNAVDFDIGSPSAYDNKGRYPLMIVMGCFSGQCSLPLPGIGEQFLLAPGRGAIAYFASVNFSYPHALHNFGRRYYHRLGGEDYGRSVGEVLRNTITDLQNTNDEALVALLHQSLLQGDPALKLHHYPGPDYVIDPETVRFDPNPVSLDQPSLKMSFDVVNLGENSGDSLPLRIAQRLPAGTLLDRLADTVAGPPFRQNLSYPLPTAGSAVGFNRFFLSLDPQDAVAEAPLAAELNNELTDATGQPGVEVYFFADDVSPVSPAPYAIVRGPAPVLRASTLKFNAAPAGYMFELDTVEKFNSPFRQTFQMVQRGGLLEWKPAVPWQDSTVYYWRVARDSLVNGQLAWRGRSFLYLSGSAPGWNQSHFGQYAEGTFVNLQAVDSTRSLEFADNAGFIAVTAAYRNVERYPGMQNAYYEGLFGDAGLGGEGIVQGVMLMVQNPNTGHTLPNLPGTAYNSTTKKKRFFFFDTRDSLKRVALMDFIENVIPPDHVVGLLALHPYNDTLGYAPRRWARDSVSYGKNLFSVLEAQGARNVRGLVNYDQRPYPYGFIFRKGNPQFDAVDTVVYGIDSAHQIRRSFLAKWSVGELETQPAGPAKKWKSLHWRPGPKDDPSDVVALSVLGVREGLGDTLLLSLQSTFDTSLEFVSAAQFPQLRLRYESSDTLTRSATQPVYLRLLYDPVPEGALHPLAHFAFHTDTLQEGEPGRFSLAFANVSDAAFDTLLVKFRVENESATGADFFRRFRPLPPGDTLHATFDLKTAGLRGKHRLLVDANPAGDQPEQYHFNNTALQEFYVSRDGRNPLLDVTFDGTHLLDGDIVSPKPVVVVSLRDENRYLALSDSATFALHVLLPDGTSKTLSAGDPSVQFLPANPAALPQKNQARLEWRPEFSQDGDYELRARGRDATGNASGALDYSVRFRVITASSLSNLLNYPNPFSTSTCFVYTMTGAETPAFFKLQILTVSGKVVREVSAAEFGPLRAGTHRSSFCWDGRDQYGDPLANGVYLYRVLAKKSDGTDFEFFENAGVDGFFKGGVGKMVLMR